MGISPSNKLVARDLMTAPLTFICLNSVLLTPEFYLQSDFVLILEYYLLTAFLFCHFVSF